QMPSFSREAIDWDEATFMVMAQDVLRGHLPYVDLFDNKPPLAFFLLGGAMALFGQTLEVVRWFGDVCICLSAAMIFAICRTRAGDMAAAVVAAAFVAAHAAAFGLHTSTEIIANVFVTGALWLVLDFGHRRSTAPLAGLLVALAVLTRSNLVFVAVGLGLIYLAGAVRPSS